MCAQNGSKCREYKYFSPVNYLYYITGKGQSHRKGWNRCDAFIGLTLWPRAFTWKADTFSIFLTQELILLWVIFPPYNLLCSHIHALIVIWWDFCLPLASRCMCAKSLQDDSLMLYSSRMVRMVEKYLSLLHSAANNTVNLSLGEVTVSLLWSSGWWEGSWHVRLPITILWV